MRVRELTAGTPKQPPSFASGSVRPTDQRIASDGESILIGYEWWTEPVYDTWWSTFLAIQTRDAPQLINADQKQKDRFNLAWNDLIERLRDPKCAEIFGGYENAIKALEETNFVLDLQGNQENHATYFPFNDSLHSASGMRGTLYIDPKAGFFAINCITLSSEKYGQVIPASMRILDIDGMPRYFGTITAITFNDDIAGSSFILLHELLHILDPTTTDERKI